MRLPLACLLLALLALPVVAQDQPPDEPPALPEKLGKLTLAFDAGWHTDQIRKVLFMPDGKSVITLSSDHSIRIWDPLTGEMRRVLYPPGVGGLGAAALSADGTRLALASQYPGAGHVIYVLTLPEGRIERILRGHTGKIGALAFSPDGKRLVSGSSMSYGKKDGDDTTRLWNLDKEGAGQVIRKEGAKALCFSPDGGRLVWIIVARGEIIDLGTGKKAAVLKGYNGVGNVNEVDWSPDGKTLATISGKGVNLWDANGKPGLLLPTNGIPASVVFSRDSRTLLATWNADYKDINKATLFEVHTGKQLLDFPSGKKDDRFSGLGAFSGALSPDGELAVTAGAITTSVWSTQNGALKKAWVVNLWPPDVAAAAWSTDGKVVARTNIGKTANTPTFHLADLQVGPRLGKKDARGPLMKQGDWSLKKVGRTVQILKNGEPTPIWFKGVVRGVTLVAKDRVALASDVSPFGLYDAQTGKLIRRFPGHYSGIHDDGIAASPDGRFLLSIGRDQTLKIWNPDREKPLLLTLYMSGKDWIVWTPEGYYAATPGGEKLMGWKVDNGIDKMPSFYPAERFRKTLHRPDVIKKAFELGSVAAALKALDGDKAKPADIEQSLPPKATLKILQDAGGQVTVQVSAEAQARTQPVVALRLLLDGRPLPDGLKEFDPAQAKATAEFTLDVPPGRHSLAVLARSEDASALSEAVTVGQIVVAQQPVLHLLAIGINDYQNGIPKLNCAVNDAKDLEKAFPLVKQGGLFRDVKTHTLLDKEATAPAIRKKLTALRPQLKQEDVLVVFFAGHGVKDDKEFFLLTAEADLKELKTTALSGTELSKKLRDLPCAQVLLLLDACHSGAFPKGRRPATDDAARAFADDEVGVTVLAAAMGHQKALEKDGNGYFTAAIKEALAGGEGVPRNIRDHRLYVSHLYTHVLDVVGERSNHRQQPFLSLPSTVAPFPLRQFAKK